MPRYAKKRMPRTRSEAEGWRGPCVSAHRAQAPEGPKAGTVPRGLRNEYPGMGAMRGQRKTCRFRVKVLIMRQGWSEGEGWAT
jgi:hypothetical protein